MDPSAVGVILRLGEFVGGVPFAAQAMPDGAQHWRRKVGRLFAIEAEDERVDWVSHCELPRAASRVLRDALPLPIPRSMMFPLQPK
jgi:hypothetical protein